MMTRTQFKAVAEIVRKYNTTKKFDDLEFYHFVDELAKYFRTDNPTFDRAKFIRACGWYND